MSLLANIIVDRWTIPFWPMSGHDAIPLCTWACATAALAIAGEHLPGRWPARLLRLPLFALAAVVYSNLLSTSGYGTSTTALAVLTTAIAVVVAPLLWNTLDRQWTFAGWLLAPTAALIAMGEVYPFTHPSFSCTEFDIHPSLQLDDELQNFSMLLLYVGALVGISAAHPQARPSTSRLALVGVGLMGLGALTEFHRALLYSWSEGFWQQAFEAHTLRDALLVTLLVLLGVGAKLARSASLRGWVSIGLLASVLTWSAVPHVQRVVRLHQRIDVSASLCPDGPCSRHAPGAVNVLPFLELY